MNGYDISTDSPKEGEVVSWLIVLASLPMWLFVASADAELESAATTSARSAPSPQNLSAHLSSHAFAVSRRTNLPICASFLSQLKKSEGAEQLPPLAEGKSTQDNMLKGFIGRCPSLQLIQPWEKFVVDPTLKLYALTPESDSQYRDQYYLFSKEGFQIKKIEPTQYKPYIGGVASYRLLDLKSCSYKTDWIKAAQSGVSEEVIKLDLPLKDRSPVRGWYGVVKHEGYIAIYMFDKTSLPSGFAYVISLREPEQQQGCDYKSKQYLDRYPE